MVLLAQFAARLTAVQVVASLQISSGEISHKIISTAIPSLLLIQIGQLSITGKIMCT